MKATVMISFLTLTLTPLALAGPLSYGICQAGCASIVMACYAAAGKMHNLKISFPTF